MAVRWDKLDGNKLTVSSAGRDEVLGFAPDDWIELTDDGRDLRGVPGLLVQVTLVDGKEMTVDPHGQTVDFDEYEATRKVRRWDMPGDTGLIAVNLTSPTIGSSWKRASRWPSARARTTSATTG